MTVSARSAAIFSPPAQNRALGLCVMASIALHALALLLPGLRPGGPTPAAAPVLTATLAPRVTAEPAPPPEREASAQQDPAPGAPKSDPERPDTEVIRPKLALPAQVEPPEPAQPNAEVIPPISKPARPLPEPVRPKPTLPARVEPRPEPARPKTEPIPPISKPVRPQPGPVPPRPAARPKPENRRPEIALAAPSSQVPGAAQAGRAAADAPLTPPGASASESAAGGNAAGAAKVPSARPAAGTAPSASEADTGILQRYRTALIVSARRYKRYPAQAMDKGWQGRVEVRLVVGANGRIRTSQIKASSGHAVLDRQALDMVRKAKPLTPIPAALRGREFTVDIPVIFDLRSG